MSYEIEAAAILRLAAEKVEANWWDGRSTYDTNSICAYLALCRSAGELNFSSVVASRIKAEELVTATEYLARKLTSAEHITHCSAMATVINWNDLTGQSSQRIATVMREVADTIAPIPHNAGGMEIEGAPASSLSTEGAPQCPNPLIGITGNM